MAVHNTAWAYSQTKSNIAIKTIRKKKQKLELLKLKHH